MVNVNPATSVEKVELSCSTEYKDYDARTQQDIWSLITLKAPVMQESDDSKRAPVDMVTVIDKSGSMAGAKLNLVKKTLEFVVSQLNENDRLAIVTYDTQVSLDYQLNKMTADNKTVILDKIRAVQPGSMTNLSGGLIKGLAQIVRRNPEEKNEVASVLLFTDGLANHGITSKQGIVAAMQDPLRLDGPAQNEQPKPHVGWLKKVYKGKAPVKNNPAEQTVELPAEKSKSTFSKNVKASVYTFGFGADHDAEMLKEISDAGNGMYYFIENADKIAESFGHCIGGLLSTVAQGIQLEVLLGDGVVVKEVHAARPSERLANSVKVNMGDLQSEESRDVVLELTLNALDAPADAQKLFTAQLNYFNALKETLDSEQTILSVQRPEKASEHTPEVAHTSVSKQMTRVKLNQVMKSAYDMAEADDLEGAQNLMQAQMEMVQERAARFDDEEDLCYMGAIVEDAAQCQKAMSSSSMWRKKGKKIHLNVAQSHEQQRSSNVESKSYATAIKRSALTRAKDFVSK